VEKKMKLTKRSGPLALAVLAAIASPLALAEDHGWYLGANVGESRAKIDDQRIMSNLLGSGFTSTIKDDNRDTGYKLFAGYQLNRNFALEGGYFDLGQFGFTATTVPAGTFNGNIKLHGVNMDLVGILPITERFSAFARVGAAYTEARDHFSGTGLVSVTNPNPSKKETNWKAGLGLQYAFNEHLGMRLEVERYRINDAVNNKGDVDLVSLGLVYRFGAKKTPMPTRVYAPEPVIAPPPPPAPVVIAPPPPPAAMPVPARRTKVTFSADSLFDFDKSVVKPEGREHLNKFAADLRGTDYVDMQVTGFTDRLGSREYNMKLSTRRAEAVKEYLVQSAGIPAEKINTRSLGEADPVTKPEDCKGKTATKKLIICLQPDRRVEVEVNGTR
jgi:OOP family OmpA-OmpF porin